MKNCFEKYLTEKCANCPFWADSADSQTIGCTMIASNMDCVCKRSFWDKFRKTSKENANEEV